MEKRTLPTTDTSLKQPRDIDGGIDRRTAIMAGIAAVFAPAPTFAQNAGADWAKIEAAAKKEGKLVAYSGNPRIPHTLYKLFEAKYGIPVELVEGRASEIRERIRSEQAANRPIADVTLNGYTTSWQQRTDGALQEHGPLPNIGKLVAPFENDGQIVPISVGMMGMTVNSKLISEQDMPKSWHDLLDPKWKGKILSDDPRAAGGGFVMYSVLLDKFGPEFHQKLAAQQPTFSRDIAVNVRRVAAGEFPIYVPGSFQDLLELKGLPIRGIAPQEGTPFIASATAVLKGAPRPNAARLFLNFALEEAPQREFADRMNGTTTGVTSNKIPPELAKLTKAKLLGTTDPARQDEQMAQFRTIYK